MHDEGELDRALDAGAELVGVNQRDLTTFAVDAARAARLVGRIPPEIVAVAESGIEGEAGVPGSWPRPGTRPCWWASHWYGHRTGEKRCGP